MEEVMPGVFPKNWPHPITANVLETASRDFAEMLGSLPQVSCQPTKFTSHRAKKSADVRTKIALGYIEDSRLQPQMYSGADSFFFYGAMAFIVDPDFDIMKPTIRVTSTANCYYLRNFKGDVAAFYQRWYETIDWLVAKFPEHKHKIKNQDAFHFGEHGSTMLEVVKYYGPQSCKILLPDRNLVIRDSPNPLNKTNVYIAERYRWDGEQRGQFDDVAWTQMAKARTALYGMEASDQALNAPWALPEDVTTVSLGPRSVMRSREPEKIGRVPINMPPEAYSQQEFLAGQERMGARYPEGMTGNLDASVITGQGVNALLSQANLQVKVAQELVAIALQDAIAHAFEMDEVFWPDSQKTTEGATEGARFAVRYTPAKDIKGDYSVSATYGFASGLDPNRALVFMLQLRADGNLSKDTLMRHMGHLFGVGAQEELERVDAEELEAALKQGLFQLASSIGNPEMAGMGVDPRSVVRQMAHVIEQREKGKPLHDAILEALDLPDEELNPQAPQQGSPGGDEELIPGMPPQGGSPDLNMIMAGLTPGGNPNLQSTVSRQQRTTGG
ncbi:hypothetical protein [Phytoactinopolyspora halophila]|uniref:hypothetical protein n=1 Tax=Phytoactinopolyspora halophila TaxID=1981511 RepID=UPI000F4E7546|nr:hypothetical protein [Phytoactinopolyspora halophila]